MHTGWDRDAAHRERVSEGAVWPDVGSALQESHVHHALSRAQSSVAS